jgi:DNA polymerase-1
MMRPTGSLGSQIAIVGARPGQDEVRTGIPFSGPSGQHLWRLLGVPRTECYVTNVRRDFSHTNTTPTEAEIVEVLPALRDELDHTAANVIIAVGAQALRALTNQTSIEKWRGSILSSTLLPGRKVIGVYHTAAALREWYLTYIIEHDLRRAKRESAYPHIVRPERSFLTNPTLDDAVGFLDSLGDPVSVDIETRGQDIVCVALSDDPSRAICIPFVDGRLSDVDLVYLWRRLDRVFRTRGIIGQNIQFDVSRLERLGFLIERIEFDTMLAHHLLYPEFPHDLGFITSIYTEEPYYKHEINSETLEGFWRYNCKDAACTYESYLGLLAELREVAQEEYFRTCVLSLLRPVMSMQNRGIAVDQQVLDKTRRRMELEIAYLQLQLDQAVGFPCNVRSTRDLRLLLYDVLRCPVLKRTPGGEPSTDEEVLRKLAYGGHANAETVQQIIDIRERRTLTSGFLNISLAADNRYRANYLIHGTDSGRLSSRGPSTGGPQLQNVPKVARKIFVAPPGRTLVQGDLRRAEAMFVAYDAGEERLIAVFEDPTRDLYKEMAASALAKNVNAVEPWERELFKRVCHASNYGMGPLKFITVLRLAGINIEDLAIRGVYGAKKKATYVVESYHAAYPAIRRWQKAIWEYVRPRRYIVDGLGRRRTFLDRMDEHLGRVACSTRPQSTIVGVTNIGLTRLHNQGFDVCAQVHDSLLVECWSDQMSETVRAVRDAMSVPLTVNGRTFTIPVDLQAGASWGAMEPVFLTDTCSTPANRNPLISSIYGLG